MERAELSLRQQALSAAIECECAFFSDADLADECGVTPGVIRRLRSHRPLGFVALGRVSAGLAALSAAHIAIEREAYEQEKSLPKTHQPKKGRITAMQFKKCIMEKVPLCLIDALPEQPDSRLTDSVLAALLEDVRENGIIHPGTLVRNGSRFWQADGHGRKKCGDELGIKDALYNVYTATAGQELELASFLFRKINGFTSKKMKSFSWLESYYKSGGNEGDIPNATLSHIKQSKKCLGGMEGLKFLIVHKAAPVLVVRANAAVARFGTISIDGPIPTAKTILQWAAIHKCGDVLTKLFGKGVVSTAAECRRLLAAIKHDRPISIAQARGDAPVRVVKNKGAKAA
jgi:hypothetical protein